jgi:hypothetical protein
MSIFALSPSKFQFSGHETFPLRQLWLRKAYVAVANAQANQEITKKVFSDDSAISRFGVGKNMVSAIRHWALACDVIKEVEGDLRSGEIGDFLFGVQGVDQYLERPATCWLVHWCLAGRQYRTTTWYHVFNKISSESFGRGDIEKSLKELALEGKHRVSDVTLTRDVDVCLRCYVARQDGRDTDDTAEPLLVELGLISESDANTFRFRRGAQSTLPDGLFAFALAEFWLDFEMRTGSSQNTLSFESIAHDHGSPGSVFKLDTNAVADRLIALESVTNGLIQWTDSGGIRQVSRKPNAFENDSKFTFLRDAYAS